MGSFLLRKRQSRSRRFLLPHKVMRFFFFAPLLSTDEDRSVRSRERQKKKRQHQAFVEKSENMPACFTYPVSLPFFFFAQGWFWWNLRHALALRSEVKGWRLCVGRKASTWGAPSRHSRDRCNGIAFLSSMQEMKAEPCVRLVQRHLAREHLTR